MHACARATAFAGHSARSAFRHYKLRECNLFEMCMTRRVSARPGTSPANRLLLAVIYKSAWVTVQNCQQCPHMGPCRSVFRSLGQPFSAAAITRVPHKGDRATQLWGPVRAPLCFSPRNLRNFCNARFMNDGVRRTSAAKGLCQSR